LVHEEPQRSFGHDLVGQILTVAGNRTFQSRSHRPFAWHYASKSINPRKNMAIHLEANYRKKFGLRISTP